MLSPSTTPTLTLAVSTRRPGSKQPPTGAPTATATNAEAETAGSEEQPRPRLLSHDPRASAQSDTREWIPSGPGGVPLASTGVNVGTAMWGWKGVWEGTSHR